jgi:hypothetical protein
MAEYDGGIMEVANDYQRRPLPKNRFLRVATSVVVAAATALFVWLSMVLKLEWLAALPFLFILPLGHFWFWVRRCPACGDRLSRRQQNHPTTTAYRIVLRCDRCVVDWDTGYRGDSKHNE